MAHTWFPTRWWVCPVSFISAITFLSPLSCFFSMVLLQIFVPPHMIFWKAVYKLVSAPAFPGLHHQTTSLSPMFPFSVYTYQIPPHRIRFSIPSTSFSILHWQSNLTFCSYHPLRPQVYTPKQLGSMCFISSGPWTPFFYLESYTYLSISISSHRKFSTKPSLPHHVNVLCVRLWHVHLWIAHSIGPFP